MQDDKPATSVTTDRADYGMNGPEHLRLLDAIYRLAMLPYPYLEHSGADDRVVLALGHIAGIASKAIKEVTGQSPNLRR